MNVLEIIDPFLSVFGSVRGRSIMNLVQPTDDQIMWLAVDDDLCHEPFVKEGQARLLEHATCGDIMVAVDALNSEGPALANRQHWEKTHVFAYKVILAYSKRTREIVTNEVREPLANISQVFGVEEWRMVDEMRNQQRTLGDASALEQVAKGALREKPFFTDSLTLIIMSLTIASTLINCSNNVLSKLRVPLDTPITLTQWQDWALESLKEDFNGAHVGLGIRSHAYFDKFR